MEPRRKKYAWATSALFATCICVLFASGCARYARTVNVIYEPSASIHGGSGEVYIVIPETGMTRSPESTWVLGKVTDYNKTYIDDVTSRRSPAEIIQSALGQEFKKAGYTVTPVTKRPDGERHVIDLTKTEISLNQISDYAGLKAECRVLAGMELLKNGVLIKRLQYESTSSRSDLKDRDLLAGIVLEDSLKSVMLKAMPDLHLLFKPEVK